MTTVYMIVSRDKYRLPRWWGTTTEKLAEEINEGRIERKHIKDVLKDECGVVFGD